MIDGTLLTNLIGASLGLGGSIVILLSLFVYLALPLLALALVLNVRKLRQQAERLNASIEAIRLDLAARRSDAPVVAEPAPPRRAAGASRGPIGL